MPENRKVWVACMKPTEPMVHVADDGRKSVYYGVTSRNVYMYVETENEWRVMQIISATVSV